MGFSLEEIGRLLNSRDDNESLVKSRIQFLKKEIRERQKSLLMSLNFLESMMNQKGENIMNEEVRIEALPEVVVERAAIILYWRELYSSF